MSNMGSSSSYRRPVGETTEWEDILVAKGIVPPKADPASEERAAREAVEASVEAAAAARAADPHAEKSLAELDEAAEEEGDSAVIASYRAARIAQIKEAAARNKFGMVSAGVAGQSNGWKRLLGVGGS